MLTPSEYLALKARMLLAAEAASLIARTGDTVRFDEEMYPLVLEAMKANKDDARRILAECDILRSMTQKAIFPQKGLDDASHVAPDNAGTLASVPEAHAEVRGPEVPPDHAGDGRAVPAGGADGTGTKRPKSRRNRKAARPDSEPVGRSDSQQ